MQLNRTFNTILLYTYIDTHTHKRVVILFINIVFVILLVFMLQSLADPYFRGLANVEREPSTQPISKLEFEFERRKLAKDDVRELIYREVCIIA